MSKNSDFKFSAHADRYPVVIARAEVQKYFPWMSAKRLANLDSLGNGPAQVIKNGRAVLYPTKSFLEWLDSRIQPQGKGNIFEQNEDDKNSAPSRRGRKTKAREVQERRG